MVTISSSKENNMSNYNYPNLKKVNFISGLDHYFLNMFLSLEFLVSKNYGLAQESAGNNRNKGVHVATAPAPFLVNRAAGPTSTKKGRIHFR